MPDVLRVSIRLIAMRLRRPRQWGACWLAMVLWDQLRMDDFWGPALPPSREGTDWLNVLKTLVAYRLISPGSEWRLHRAPNVVKQQPRKNARKEPQV